MNKYILHFRQSDFPLIFTDIVLRLDCYGQFDYRILQKKDEAVGYLTKKGIRETREFGMRLLNDEFSSKITQQLKSFNSEFKNKELSKRLKKIHKNHLVQRWKEIENCSIKMIKLYRYCEQPILAPLEEIIFKACSNQDNMIKIFKNPKMIKNLNFTTKEQKIFYLLIQLGELKFSIHNNVMGDLIEEINKFAQTIAKKYNISINQALSLRNFEIKQILNSNKIPKIKQLNERIKGCIFLPSSNNKRWRLLTGKKYLFWKKKLIPKHFHEIKGTIAYSGKVKGIVKLHLSLTKVADISENSVIVTGMTNPQIMPCLKKAVAIITDEGGITCHAAIISRELKIPCIIGTKIATQVLKDGDLVEVDADEGVVKLIKKNQKYT